MLNTDGA
ncbi:hypothetical protein HaLaN_00133, partial [Haematococcus lacustris]